MKTKKKAINQQERIKNKRQLDADIVVERRRIFLEEYAKFGTKTTAAKIAGISRVTIDKWEKSDKEFSDLMKQANEEMIESLEKCAIERATAVDGSDPLLMFMLKSLDRNKYGERIRHEFAMKTLDAVVNEVIEAVRVNVPDFCPHCNTALSITQSVAKDLVDMSARLTGTVKEDEVIAQ